MFSLIWLAGFLAPGLAWTAEVAILTSAEVQLYTQAVDAFKSVLPRGTAIMEYQIKGDVNEGRQFGRAIRASKSDVVFAVGLKAALVAKLEVVDTPIIFGMVLDPGDHGLPAPKMIGIAMRIPPDQQLAAIRNVLPSIKRVGLLYDPGKTGSFVQQARREAKRAGMELVASPVSSAKDLPEAARNLLGSVESLWIIRDETVVSHGSIRFLIEAALDHNIPVFGFSPVLVEYGALCAISIAPADIGHQAGLLARDILSGEAVALGRLVDPAQTRLALNLNTAEFLGIVPAAATLKLADTLIGGPGSVAQESKRPEQELLP